MSLPTEKKKVWPSPVWRLCRFLAGGIGLNKQLAFLSTDDINGCKINITKPSQWWVKNPLANAGDVGSIPVSGRSPGGGNDNPLQYSCWENPKDRGVWRATACGGHKESDTTELLKTHARIWPLTVKRLEINIDIPCFGEVHFTPLHFKKTQYEYLFSLTERNQRRICAFMKKKKKVKIENSVQGLLCSKVLQRQQAPQAGRVAPQIPSQNYTQHPSI